MKKILFLLGLSFFAFQLNSFASIDVTGDTGIIKITPPGGGTPITINPGQPIPAIADGSTIQIVTGSLTVATTAPSTVNLTANGNTIGLTPGNTVKVSLNTNGAVKVSDSNGTASIKTSDGKTSLLAMGNTIVIAGNVVRNAEAYQPPDNNPGPGVNTQVLIDNGGKDISAQ
jgi:hypothetical protein